MIFLRILRVVLVVAGLAVLGVAYFMGLSTQGKGSYYPGSWAAPVAPAMPGGPAPTPPGGAPRQPMPGQQQWQQQNPQQNQGGQW